MTTFVTRAEWGARAPKGRTADTTYRGIAVHWEGPRMGWPWDHAKCAAKVRGIQAYHMDGRRWDDIAYNFVACGHDYVFEGRGWGVRSAANGDGERNTAWLAVCYLGGEGDGFPEGGRRAIRWVLDEARRRGYREWTTHRSMRATACPGNEIHNWVFAGAPVQGTSEDEDMPTPQEIAAAVWAHPLKALTTGQAGSAGQFQQWSHFDGYWARKHAEAVAKNLRDVIREELAASAGGSVDVDALADRLATKLAERLAS